MPHIQEYRHICITGLIGVGAVNRVEVDLRTDREFALEINAIPAQYYCKPKYAMNKSVHTFCTGVNGAIVAPLAAVVTGLEFVSAKDQLCALVKLENLKLAKQVNAQVISIVIGARAATLAAEELELAVDVALAMVHMAVFQMPLTKAPANNSAVHRVLGVTWKPAAINKYACVLMEVQDIVCRTINTAWLVELDFAGSSEAHSYADHLILLLTFFLNRLAVNDKEYETL